MDGREEVECSLERLEAELLQGLWLHRLHLHGGPRHVLLLLLLPLELALLFSSKPQSSEKR